MADGIGTFEDDFSRRLRKIEFERVTDDTVKLVISEMRSVYHGHRVFFKLRIPPVGPEQKAYFAQAMHQLRESLPSWTVEQSAFREIVLRRRESQAATC